MAASASKSKGVEAEAPPEAQEEPKIASEEEYDENEDDDYDPSKKPENVDQDEDSDSENEAAPDYSAIESGVSQVRTRGQKIRDNHSTKSGGSLPDGLVQDYSRIDAAKIFEEMNTQVKDDWSQYIDKDAKPVETEKKEESAVEQKIQIFTTYTFAGKLVRESKEVDISSAEAKAYLNSTNRLIDSQESNGPHKSFVTVMRKVAGSDEHRELRIKLKRPSLIDKFLAGDKKNKLTTLEKSRLDWASFVDKKRLKDDLATHNKGGYLDKQDFLGRMEAKRNTQYMQAKELERQKQWQQQQKRQ